MDDISRHLSISKKTIYQHFADKDNLVLEVTKSFLSHQRCEVDTIYSQAADVVEELVHTGDYMLKMISTVNPVLLFDLRKYHPSSWREFQTHKKQYITLQIKRSLERGIKEGFFRKELDVDVLATLRVETIEMVFNPDIFPFDKFNFLELNKQMLDHFIYGICTVKGHQRYNELKMITE